MYILTYKNKRLLKSKLIGQYSFVEHAFSTRDFGNLGLHVGDKKEMVIANRKLFARSLDIDFEKLVSAKQVHGNNVVRVTLNDLGKGAEDYETSIDNTDGLITNDPGLPLFAFYADCVPIFLVDPVQKAIGIVHSGWKGTLNNIAANIVDAFVKEFNSRSSDLIAVIGPYICKDCYEVSNDIIEKFKHAGFIKESDYSDNKIDLGLIIKNQLLAKGLNNIEIAQYCTSCELDMFYSHRKELGNTGRMAGIIMIKGDQMDTLKKNLDIIKSEIEETMELANRTDQVLLVGVTKTFPVDVITDGLNLGIFDVGENKAQEFSGKYDIIRDKVNWHFIGHLQKNKVKYVVGKAKLIHSVDSFELAEEISKRSLRLDVIQDVLIEVNVSGEESKFGVRIENIQELLHKISGLDGIRVKGLMTMAPNVDDETIVRNVFKGLRLLKEEIADLNISNIHMDYLSMGMSQDFKWAILEGANIIRVGSSLYGKR